MRQVPVDNRTADWPRKIAEAINALQNRVALSGEAVWGSITGTLGDQTDLGVALAGKAAASHTHVEGDVSGLAGSLAGKQPLDGDLTAISALTGTNTIYYRSGADTWSAVTIGSGVGFSGGTLTATGTGGTVTSVEASGGATGLTFSGGPITGSGTLTLGGTLAVANGGTGVTTSTGTGSAVLSASPALTGTVTAAAISASGRVTSAQGLIVSGVAAPSSGSALELYYNGTNGLITAFNRTGGVYLPIVTQSSTLTLSIGSTPRLSIDASGNVFPTSGTTTMTAGFIYIPAAAGAPTGVPTAIAGRVPLYYDTTNNQLCIYNAGWKKVTLA